MEGRILITGGAGFLARGIYRKARCEGWDAEFTCLSRDDSKHVALNARYPEVDCVRGDVNMDRDWLTAIMAGRKIDTVIHAAAAKYVDLSEFNAIDTVHTNIDGSRNVLLAAISAGVKNVVGISTDKAVEPINIYGMTKAVMERMFVEGDDLGDTKFNVVRYGNVIGSTGSVIPKFMALARAGKPLALTESAMTRFWMPVDDAVSLVEDAVNYAKGGIVVIPTMRALSMASLADIISAEFGGVGWFAHGARPGEKWHETILGVSEVCRSVGLVSGGYEIHAQRVDDEASLDCAITSEDALPMADFKLKAAIADAEDV